MRRLVTIVETRAYLARAEKLLDVAERDAIKLAIAADPLAGDLIRGSGGVRKLRFGLDGRGKRGGVRIIYYFHDDACRPFCSPSSPRTSGATFRKVRSLLCASWSGCSSRPTEDDQ